MNLLYITLTLVQIHSSGRFPTDSATETDCVDLCRPSSKEYPFGSRTFYGVHYGSTSPAPANEVPLYMVVCMELALEKSSQAVSEQAVARGPSSMVNCGGP